MHNRDGTDGLNAQVQQDLGELHAKGRHDGLCLPHIKLLLHCMYMSKMCVSVTVCIIIICFTETYLVNFNNFHYRHTNMLIAITMLCRNCSKMPKL